MTTPRPSRARRPTWAAPLLAFVLILASCGSDGGETSATTVDAGSNPETTLASATPTTGAETDSEADSESESIDDTGQTTTTVGDSGDDPDDGADDEPFEPDDDGDLEPWQSSNVADAVLSAEAIEAAFTGSWELDSVRVTEPEDAPGGTTCGVADPPMFDGLEAQFFSWESELEIGQIIQVGDGVEVWVSAFEGLASCEDDLVVELIDIDVAGADSSAIIRSTDEGGDGYIAGGGAQRGDVFVGIVAFGDDERLLPQAETLASLLSTSLGEAVVLAATGDVGAGPAMALTEQDLVDVGLGGDFELTSVEEFDADTSIEPWDGEACSFVNSRRFDGFNAELVGPFGDPRIAQIVTTSSDAGLWIESFAGLAGCGDEGGIPLVRADLWVEGAEDAVVLGPDGVDAEGTSYAAAAAVVDDLAVVIIVFADTPDDPALDVRTVSELAAIALGRR